MKPSIRRDPLREAYTMRYGLSQKQRKSLTPPLLNQLQACKSEEARRLILGVSESVSASR
jgi:hypothetical protein